MNKHPVFEGGKNIAMKVPPHLWEQTTVFYRDLLRLKVIEEGTAKESNIPYVCFQFGECHLWIDQVKSISQSEIWLEVKTNDIHAAAKVFEESNVIRRDEIEKLPDGLSAFWIQNPASIIHLVSEGGGE